MRRPRRLLSGYPEIDTVDLLEQGKVIKVALRDGNERRQLHRRTAGPGRLQV